MRGGDPETEAICAFVQGALAAGFMRQVRGEEPFLPGIQIAEVDVPTDEQDNYRDHIVVTMRSGKRIKIRVTPDEQTEEVS